MPLLCLKLQWTPISFRTKPKVLTCSIRPYILCLLLPLPGPKTSLTSIPISFSPAYSDTGYSAVPSTCQGCSFLKSFTLLVQPAWNALPPDYLLGTLIYPSDRCSNGTFSVRLLWPFYLKLTSFFAFFIP